MGPSLIIVASTGISSLAESLVELCARAMEPISKAGGTKIFCKRKVVVVVLEGRVAAGKRIARVGLDRSNLEVAEGENHLRPVVRNEHHAENVGEQVGESVLGHCAVGGCEADGRGVLVVLLVESRVERFRVEGSVDVEEA